MKNALPASQWVDFYMEVPYHELVRHLKDFENIPMILYTSTLSLNTHTSEREATLHKAFNVLIFS